MTWHTIFKVWWFIKFATKAVLLGLFVLLCTIAITKVAKADEETVWLTTGMWSRHDHNVNCPVGQACKERYRQNNTGIGIELPQTEDWSVVAGWYNNSIHRETIYAGATYQPLHIGPTKFGVFGAMATGYADYFPAIPVGGLLGTVEEGKYGLNVMWLPNVVTAVQLKVRIK